MLLAQMEDTSRHFYIKDIEFIKFFIDLGLNNIARLVEAERYNENGSS